ncbi:MAG: hypothetical protein KIT10_14180 [Flavobacteriales bacterium]|nr:hypothetical protein [Flavobacteriales bacterium]
MNRLLLIPIVITLAACAPKAYVFKGVHEGVEVSYRWAHPTGKPSELLLKLVNTAQEDKRLELVIDLYYQGRTVESLSADTCIRVGQTLNGKLNGIYFIPERLTTEQIKSNDSAVELTHTRIVGDVCR